MAPELMNLPLELRQMIWDFLLVDAEEHCKATIAGRRRLVLRFWGSLVDTIVRTRSDLLLVNKRVAVEILERLFKRHTPTFDSGPQILHVILRRLPSPILEWIRSVELKWCRFPPEPDYDHLDITEVRPLMDFIGRRTSIRTITVTLELHSSQRRPNDISIDRNYYWCMVIAYAMQLVLVGLLDEVCVQYTPDSVWALLEPEDDIQSMVHQKPSQWASPPESALSFLVEQLETRGIAGAGTNYSLDNIVARMGLQEWHQSNGVLEDAKEFWFVLKAPQEHDVYKQDGFWCSRDGQQFYYFPLGDWRPAATDKQPQNKGYDWVESS
ncbi:hypothetical protein BDY21DRAFT_369905 [Lineolata rhizophorae]|uniref:F-box domain-containing protein n=1 Tax=Lineolata rhizophorae TaxID=578093 RepID=A0A6A6P7N1_9PEZI|nr:hypothetical protein BDY21DRAFT_369905 [Lineolata rhizophorae]